ncbi:MAG: hypothetical protein K2L86_05085 [Lachnospiraceae bacterium]|nr:hypothetical protein [Lachnospiraceae bacterium]
MYRVNRPLRMVEINNNMYLLSVPRIGLRFEINDYVAELLGFMQTKGNFDFSAIEEYMERRHICNTDDYKVLVRQMTDMKVLVEE